MTPLYLVAMSVLLVLNPQRVAADPLTNAKLVDMFLLAAIDGNFHALNRSTGHTLWSTELLSGRDGYQSPLAPLVRTSHDANTRPAQDTYLVEPQSGAIFAMPSPTGALQRLPFSVPELADMSPVAYRGRVFVARKEAAVIHLDLETGDARVGPNHPPAVRVQGAPDEMYLDVPEAVIAREEYHVAVHAGQTLVADLYFARYGPREQDAALPAAYREPKDGLYAESTRSGDILCIKPMEDPASGGWLHIFGDPIVAVFDVLRTPAHVFVLPQPRRQPPNATAARETPSLNKVYVGMLNEARSLFAMSAERFPWVASSSGRQRRWPMTPQPLPRFGETQNLTAAQKVQEREDGLCRSDPSVDLWCLTGPRQLEAVSMDERLR